MNIAVVQDGVRSSHERELERLSRRIRTMPKRASRPVVVHLGNVGIGNPGEIPAKKTRDYARLFPNVRFIGIDSRAIDPTLVNWREQHQGSFGKIITRMPDASVDLFTSDYAWGNYSSWQPTYGSEEEDARQIFRALKPGGKVLVAVMKERAESLRAKLEGAGFKQANIKLRPLKPREYNRTHWLQFSGSIQLEFAQITAVKPKG